MNIICKLFGHRYEEHLEKTNMNRYVFVDRCTRCGKVISVSDPEKYEKVHQ